ncbi:hypothetical protein VTI74DRAFT_9630 [Chaetomium olivicolor]
MSKGLAAPGCRGNCRLGSALFSRSGSRLRCTCQASCLPSPLSHPRLQVQAGCRGFWGRPLLRIGRPMCMAAASSPDDLRRTNSPAQSLLAPDLGWFENQAHPHTVPDGWINSACGFPRRLRHRTPTPQGGVNAASAASRQQPVSPSQTAPCGGKVSWNWAPVSPSVVDGRPGERSLPSCHAFSD